ncbi:hypothetical protein N9W57_04200 [Pseudomonadales bacterium]|nr:hypothetical protein [Pseudomonadales bacterium]
MFIWDLNDATAPYSVPNAPIFFIALTFILTYAFLKQSKMEGLAFEAKIMLWLLVSCAFCGVLMTPLRDDFYLKYFLSDAGVMFFFGIAFLACAGNRQKLESENTIKYIAILYSVFALIAYLSAAFNLRPEYWWHGRWDPPYCLLFAYLGLKIRLSHNMTTTIFYSILSAPALILSFSSGNRTQFFLALIFIAAPWANKFKFYAMLIFLIVTFYAFIIGGGGIGWVRVLIENSRFGLLRLDGDASLLGRFNELRDIWVHMVQLGNEWQLILGRGFGATWQQLTGISQENIIDNGPTIHYIHMGFVNLSYRYGIFGLALFSYFTWLIVRNVGVLYSTSTCFPLKFWYLSAVGFVVNFFVQNSMYDPPAVIGIAAFVTLNNKKYLRQAEVGFIRCLS